MHPFPHPLGVALGAQQADLLGEARDVGGQGEELDGEVFGETAEFGVVAILRVVAAAHGGRLRLHGGELVEGHGCGWGDTIFNGSLFRSVSLLLCFGYYC